MDYTTENILKLATPLDGEPAGSDPADFTEFDQIEAELAKAEAIERQKIDFNKICKLSVELLTDKTKDLRIASYLAFSLYQNESFEGLEKGFLLLKELVDSDLWETIFPRRRKRQGKARAAALTWLVSRIEKSIDGIELDKGSNHNAIINCHEAYKACEQAFDSKLGDDFPSIFDFTAKFKRFADDASRWLEEIEQEKNQEQEQQAPASSDAPAGGSTAATPQVASVSLESDGLDKVLGGLGNTLDQISNYHKTNNPFDPNVFYFARLAKWLQVQAIPADKVIPPIPQPAQLQRLKELEQQKDYKALIDDAEQMFRAGAIFCMSLHRYIYVGLMGLNQDECAETVAAAARDYARRFPELNERVFQDGSSFVDAQTKLWLNQNSNQSKQSEDEGSDTDASPQSVYEKAEALLAQGKEEIAISVMQGHLTQCKSDFDKLQTQFYTAQLLSQLDQLEGAIALLEEIIERKKNISIFEGHTTFSAQTCSLLLNCYNRVKMNRQLTEENLQTITQLQRDLYARDPVLALKIQNT